MENEWNVPFSLRDLIMMYMDWLNQEAVPVATIFVVIMLLVPVHLERDSKYWTEWSQIVMSGLSKSYIVSNNPP